MPYRDRPVRVRSLAQRSSQRIETGQIEYAEMWQQVANTIANLLGSSPT